MKSFIGLPISVKTQSTINTLCMALKNLPVKWTKSEKRHITLRFLGQISIEKMLELKLVLTEIASKTESFTLELKTLSTFPPLNPRYLVVNVGLNQALAKLFHQINQACETLGFQRDSRLFLPHITLAKCNYLPKLPTLNNVPLPIIEIIKQVILYESKLDNEQSVYHIISCHQLT